MVDGEGEGGAGGARVQVGRPVVGVERVERGVGRGKPGWNQGLTHNSSFQRSDLSFFCCRSGR